METMRADYPLPSRGQQPEGGFTLAELVMVVAVIGILAVMAVPAFLRYYQAAKLKSGAEQVVVLVNQARELAIKRNTYVCAALASTTQMTYRIGGVSCSGFLWVGPGTDAAGNIPLPADITATVSPNPPIFDYLGSAVTSSPATYTLTNTQTGLPLTVLVEASGRVRIPTIP